jgi:hypothetical protein
LDLELEQPEVGLLELDLEHAGASAVKSMTAGPPGATSALRS